MHLAHVDLTDTDQAVEALETFFEHAHEPLSVAQIAAAARLSVSGLQHAFRDQLGVSPTGYLRQVRLERARAALLAGDPTDDDRVAALARAAGFTHLPRFAAAYRARYGENPSDTLRS
ncbi:hypothetical protein GCM10010988_22320 [Cnuibacter physcomitrellae]|uniref:helix-turn-helix transcriptional regulator n=1 Tax=Cnuibacter physcomitrellae TaxID=1619308 RepID=UPI00157C804C|nr:helix-turn-helix transcriptional regulator [Cnuibacter physcomitrellae]GGI39088.1 hypothetical protein GCM10010988_22320 [Cnuibacter physcomitrellae]